MCFHVCDFDWDQAPQHEWESDYHILDLALTPRPQLAWASFVDADRAALHPIGRMMYIPAGQLTGTAMPVAEIASRLGFSSSTSFCYAFRRCTGQRPSALRSMAGPIGANGPGSQLTQ